MWSAQDLKWLERDGHQLRLKGAFIEGWLSFSALYDGKQVVINPTDEDIVALAEKGAYIEDSYKVRIRWRPGNSEHPFTEEIGGRVEALSASLGKRLADLHVYEDSPNFLCDCAPRDLTHAFAEKFSLEKYILRFLIPRLYAQSYYEKYRKWPWGELSHHYPGLLEWFARAASITRDDLIGSARDIINLTSKKLFFHLISKKYGANHRCVCGSGRKLKDCHYDVLQGIWRIRSAKNQFKLTLPVLILEASRYT